MIGKMVGTTPAVTSTGASGTSASSNNASSNCTSTSGTSNSNVSKSSTAGSTTVLNHRSCSLHRRHESAEGRTTQSSSETESEVSWDDDGSDMSDGVCEDVPLASCLFCSFSVVDISSLLNHMEYSHGLRLMNKYKWHVSKPALPCLDEYRRIALINYLRSVYVQKQSECEQTNASGTKNTGDDIDNNRAGGVCTDPNNFTTNTVTSDNIDNTRTTDDIHTSAASPAIDTDDMGMKDQGDLVETHADERKIDTPVNRGASILEKQRKEREMNKLQEEGKRRMETEYFKCVVSEFNLLNSSSSIFVDTEKYLLPVDPEDRLLWDVMEPDFDVENDGTNNTDEGKGWKNVQLDTPNNDGTSDEIKSNNKGKKSNEELREAAFGVGSTTKKRSNTAQDAFVPSVCTDDSDLYKELLKASMCTTTGSTPKGVQLPQDSLSLSVPIGSAEATEPTTTTKPAAKETSAAISTRAISGRDISVLSTEDRGYFLGYGELSIHREMISDTVRTSAYRNFLLGNRAALSGKVVLDVGCGSAILSLFAAQAGARKVVGIDASAAISNLARRIVQRNGYEEQVQIITAKLEDVCLYWANDAEDEVLALPRDGSSATLKPFTCEVVVSEWMGYCLLYESMIYSVLHARDRYLKDGGLVIPNRSLMGFVAADLSDKQKTRRGRFDTPMYDFDLSPLCTPDGELFKVPDVCTPEIETLTSNPLPFVSIDIAHVGKQELKQLRCPFEVDLPSPPAVCTSLVVYFDCFFELLHPFNKYQQRRVEGRRESDLQQQQTKQEHQPWQKQQLRSSNNQPTQCSPISFYVGGGNYADVEAAGPTAVLLSTKPQDPVTHWQQTVIHIVDSEKKCVRLNASGGHDTLKGHISINPNPSPDAKRSIVITLEVEIPPTAAPINAPGLSIHTYTL